MTNPNDTSEWTAEDWAAHDQAVNDAVFAARQWVSERFEEKPIKS